MMRCVSVLIVTINVLGSLAANVKVNPEHATANENLTITVASGKMPPLEFHSKYVAKNQPVILQAAVSHSPALRIWSDEYLQSQLSLSVLSMKQEVPKVHAFVNNGSESKSMYVSRDMYSQVRVPSSIQCAHSRYVNMSTTLLWNLEPQRLITRLSNREMLLCVVRGEQNHLDYVYNATQETPNMNSEIQKLETEKTDQAEPRQVTTTVEIKPGDCAYVPSWWNHSFKGSEVAIGFQWSKSDQDAKHMNSCSTVFNQALDLGTWIFSHLDNSTKIHKSKLLTAFWESLRYSKLFEEKGKAVSQPFPYASPSLLKNLQTLLSGESQLDENAKSTLKYHFLTLIKNYLDRDQDDFITEAEYKMAQEGHHDYQDLNHQERLVKQIMEIVESKGVDIAKVLRFKINPLETLAKETDYWTSTNKRQPEDDPHEEHDKNDPHRLPLPDSNLDRMKHYCQEFLAAMYRLRLLHDGMFPVDMDEGFHLAWEKATLPNPYLRALFRAKPKVGDFLHVKMKKIFQTLLDMDKDYIVTKQEFHDALAGRFTDNIDFASQLVVIHNFVGSLKHEGELDLIHYIPRHQQSHHDEF